MGGDGDDDIERVMMMVMMMTNQLERWKERNIGKKYDIVEDEKDEKKE